ncbi:calcium-binding protein [Microcoleus sp. FACHB-672]|uniref:calcium-binding protein n=1 Tax=Microcoleus sp. FACHB-672 TaxID=2692825 RepID=UPI001688B5DA|nr:calcium-binding protein [Microcoleus sp. FACHB-672]MBD2039738.1 calcium-binding protein [Microcoleus sp. FACHB-672]
MSILTVTTNADSGAGSLRAAIASAQAGDTVQFSSSLANQTISLSSQIEINKHLTIDGAGATNLTISGNNASRVFYSDWSYLVPEGYNISLKNLTIANGKTTDADGGAGIRMGYLGDLTVENTTFKNNAAGKGAAIMAGTSGTTTVINSKFDANDGTSGTTDVMRERGAGGIATAGGALTVQGSEFTNNKGIVGGAINVLNTELLVENSTFVNNDTTAGAAYPSGRYQSGNGGAIYTDGANGLNEPGSIIIRKSRFEGNKAAGFGGALNLSAYQPQTVSVEDSIVLGNEVIQNANGSSLGGGIYHQDVELTINNTTVANNKAVFQGGGLWANNAGVTVSNSTFSGNIAEDAAKGYGGAIRIGGTDKAANITNTTIANNSAGWVGGGILAGSTPVTVKNTIFSNNTAANPWNIQYNTTRELTDGGGNVQWPPKATNLFNDYNATATITLADPKLGPLQDNGSGILTHALLEGSAAIGIAGGLNAGAPTTPAPTDTVVGGGGSDTITPTPTDTVVGGGGSDTITPTPTDTVVGGGGSDTITPAPTDTVVGGGGSDTITPAPTDTVVGGGGSDTITPAPTDTVVGGGGSDTITPTPTDTVVGGGGSDTITPTPTDTVVGGGGSDTITPTPTPTPSGNDVIYGEAGNDTIYAGDGNDTIYGGSGDDVIYGGAGNDIIYAEDGNDTIYGGGGDDTIYGGAGINFLNGGDGNDVIYATDDILLPGPAPLPPAQQGENSVTGTPDNDTLTGANTAATPPSDNSADTFLLANAGISSQGLSDYPILTDFNGSENLMQIQQSGSDTPIFDGNGSTKDELIGTVPTSGLTLNNSDPILV